jgi:serine/threonine protein kinase
MKCLKHDNIIKYKSLYLDKTKKKGYLVMEYINYPTLKGKRISN